MLPFRPKLTLLARIAPEHGHVEWLLLDDAGRAISEIRTNKPEAQVLRSAARVIGLVPAEKIWMGEASIAAANANQRRKAAPFAVEDQLADPIEQMHFALDAGKESLTPIFAVQRRSMQLWLQTFTELGIEPDAVYPDVLCLPLQSGAAPILLDGARVSARVSRVRGLATRVDLLELLSKQLPETRNLWRVDKSEAWPESWDSRAESPVSHALNVHAMAVNQLPEFDLLQGEFAPRARDDATRSLLRWAVGLAVAAVIANLVYAKLDEWRQRSQLTQLRTAMQTVFEQAMPAGSKAVPGRERAQMESALALVQGHGATGLLSELSKMGAVLANQPRFRLDQIDARDGRMSLTVHAPDVPALESLRESMGSNRAIKLDGIERREDGVRGQFHWEQNP